MYPITTITACLLAIIFVFLSANVIKLRQKYKVLIGSGGNEDLEMTIRGHGNFAEYVPFALILMLIAEANEANVILIGVLALLLIIGRLFHVVAFAYNKDHIKFRVRGILLTFITIIGLVLIDAFLLIFKLI